MQAGMFAAQAVGFFAFDADHATPIAQRVLTG